MKTIPTHMIDVVVVVGLRLLQGHLRAGDLPEDYVYKITGPIATMPTVDEIDELCEQLEAE